jgi:hypothetical protein
MATKKITKLTTEQTSALKTHADAWIARALEERPARRDIAERGIRAYYRIAGLADPRAIVWMPGPWSSLLARPDVARLVDASAQVSAQVSDQVHDQVHDQVSDQVSAQVHDQVHAQVYAQVSAQVSAQVYDQVRDQVHAQVSAQVRDQVYDLVYDQVYAQVRDQVDAQVGSDWTSYVGGAGWAGWPAAWATYYRDVCGMSFAPEATQAAEDATESWWWWPTRTHVVVCERPCRIRRDDRGRLHSADGAAIQWPDGWGVYCWHGRRVPKEWILHPETLTPSVALGQTNADLRSAAVEIVGWPRILAELPTRVIARDPNPQIGELLSVDLPGSPDQRCVRTVCGTGRPVVLLTSREMRTPREAIARSYGLTEEQYQPEVRT